MGILGKRLFLKDSTYKVKINKCNIQTLNDKNTLGLPHFYSDCVKIKIYCTFANYEKY